MEIEKIWDMYFPDQEICYCWELRGYHVWDSWATLFKCSHFILGERRVIFDGMRH